MMSNGETQDEKLSIHGDNQNDLHVDGVYVAFFDSAISIDSPVHESEIDADNVGDSFEMSAASTRDEIKEPKSPESSEPNQSELSAKTILEELINQLFDDQSTADNLKEVPTMNLLIDQKSIEITGSVLQEIIMKKVEVIIKNKMIECEKAESNKWKKNYQELKNHVVYLEEMIQDMFLTPP